MTTQTKQEMYRELAPLLKDAQPPKQDGRIWSFCPTHADGSKHGKRSLSLHPVYGLECFAGCEFRDIVATLRDGAGQGPVGVMTRPTQERHTHTYRYVGMDGSLIAEKGRFENGPTKRFAWKRAGQTDWGRLDPIKVEDLPLYNLSYVLGNRSAPVYFVEGEKAADACIKNDLLAVSLAGGASQRSFGTALDVLAGRTVVLWPDNDPPGRELMVALQAKLKPIARAVHIATMPMALYEKADAADYFGLGGTKEQLQSATLTGPVAEVLGHESVRVRIPTISGVFAFTFDAIITTGRSFDAELTLIREGDLEEDTYHERINLLSSSQRTELRRSLDAIYGKEHEFSSVLNKVIATVRTTYSNIDRAVDVSEIVHEGGDLLLVDPFLPADSPTILFGDGGSAKSYLAFSFAFHFAAGLPFLGMKMPGMPVLVVDWEGNARSFKFRMRRIAQGVRDSLGDFYEDVPPGYIHYWAARGIPLAEQVDALRRKVDDFGIGLVIIDSIAPACGGEPEQSIVANAYFRALARLNVTTLNIAHITKDQKSTDKPFGSVFWHNEARRTWHLKREQDSDSAVFDLGLYCKKVNDGPRPHDRAVRVTFDDPTGPVILTPSDFRESADLQRARSTPDKVWDSLAGGAKRTMAEIEEIVGGKSNTVSQSVRRLVDRGSVQTLSEMRDGKPATIYCRAVQM